MALTVLMAFGLWGAEYYQPSFDCAKVKENSIEYRICTDAKLSKLDQRLSELYGDAVLADTALKQEQMNWLKARNRCQDDGCIKQAYSARIDTLENGIEAFLKNLKKADREAEASYETDHNPYTAINILKKAGMKQAIDKHPSFFTKEAYVGIMQNYAGYYIRTKHDMAHKLNLDYAKKILDLAIKTAPEDPNSYKVLGEMYRDKLYYLRLAHGVYPIYEENLDGKKEWRFMPYKMKEAYKKYVALCEEQNIEPRLSKQEWTIVKRNQIFIDYYSTFKGQPLTYVDPPEIDKSIMYKVGFENICAEYVEMLNMLPEDELTRCSRYVNQPNSKFVHVLEDKAPEEYIKYIKPDDMGWVRGHLFQYNGEYFLDRKNALILANQLGTGDHANYPSTYPKNACLYQYVDLREKNQFDLNDRWLGDGTYDCSSIVNYRKKYITK